VVAFLLPGRCLFSQFPSSAFLVGEMRSRESRRDVVVVEVQIVSRCLVPFSFHSRSNCSRMLLDS